MIEWVPAQTGQPRDVRELIGWKEVFWSAGSRQGIHLWQSNCSPGELPEGFLLNHVVCLYLGDATRCEHYVVGEKWRREVFMPESLFVSPAGVPFAAQWPDPVSSLGIMIEPELVSNVIGPGISSSRFELRYGHCAEDRLIAQLLYALRQDLREGSPRGRLYGESLGTALVAHLVRNYAEHDQLPCTPRGRLPPNRLRRVVDYINDRLETDLSLPELAALVGLNPDYFARAFKQTTGVAPYRYVLLKRIGRACRLLHDRRISLVEIAARSGFASQSSFTTSFRRLKGITPSSYRRALV